MQLPTLAIEDEKKMKRRAAKGISLTLITMHRLTMFSLLLVLSITSYKGSVNEISSSSMYKISWGVGVTGSLLLFIEYLAMVLIHMYL